VPVINGANCISHWLGELFCATSRSSPTLQRRAKEECSQITLLPEHLQDIQSQSPVQVKGQPFLITKVVSLPSLELYRKALEENTIELPRSAADIN